MEDLTNGKGASMDSGAADGLQERENAPTYYVGIGASAGGLEAIEAFFAHMPHKTGLAFVVVQHLSPDYKSLMVELLSKRTPMPVFRAEEGMLVEQDSVYLIPPKKNLTIFHGRLLLSEQDHSRAINLPIDVFLRSLAEDQGDKAIGVILSGTGSDGMRGIRSIKEAGGMVMVQDPETAKFDGMPRSALSSGMADFILPPDDMPPQLLSFTKYPHIAKMERSETLLTDEDGLTRIFALLRERTKVDFTYYKPSTVIRRIDRRMTINQLHDFRDYVRFMETYPTEVVSLYRELLIGVTSFFRDREAFDIIAEKCIPELLERAGNREIRLWMAGCSTGEEAYSIAMLCRDTMEQMGRSCDVKIFATDVDRDAITQAGCGTYPESIAADLSPGFLARYFFRREENFHIARNIREMVVFAQHNLVKDPPFTNIDFISCRNLLIYLQPVLQKRILELFNFSLNAQGVLFLGSSETTGEMADHFEPINHKWKIYRSRGKKKPAGIGSDILVPYDAKGRPVFTRVSGTHHALRTQGEERMLDRFLQSLAGDYVPLAIVVNEQMELLHVLGDTEGFFRLPMGKMQNDVTKMAVRDLVIPLATGIQRVFKNREEMRYSSIRLKYRDTVRNISMHIKPLAERKGQESLVVVFIEEAVGNERKEPANDLQAYDLGKEAQQRIADLEQELQFTKENLQATIEELETSNEELQATNEELLASNEELQSTNEELQSVNEELFTVNAEYQSKIFELTELTNDIDNILVSTQIGTLILDENLAIRKFTPQITQIYKILDKDIGRPITHLTHRLMGEDPLDAIRNVQKSSNPMEQEVQNTEGSWFLMRVLPYIVGPQVFSGVMLAFIDISLLKEAQKLQMRNEAILLETSRAANIGNWELDLRTGGLIWNEEVFHIYGVDRNYKPGFKAMFDFCTPYSRPALQNAFQKAMDTGSPFDLEVELFKADNSKSWVRIIGKGAVVGDKTVNMSGTIQDVTLRRSAQVELSAAREMLAGVLNSILHCVMVFESVRDEAGKIVDFKWLLANPAASRSIGKTCEELKGKRMLEVLPANQENGLFYEYVRVVEENRPWQGDRYVEHEGSGAWYSIAVAKLSDGFVVSYEVITGKNVS